MFDNYKAARVGVRKAQRDIALAEKHLTENDNKLNYADPIWEELGADVDRDNPFERHGYDTTRARFMQKWVKANPLAYAAAMFEDRASTPESSIIIVPAELLPDILAGTLTQQQVDELAAEHGHTTPEEECGTILNLRILLNRQSQTDQ